MKKIKLILFLLLVFGSLCSCISQKNCIKKTNLCGIVVDENNRPIPNYQVICYNNLLAQQSAYTNSSGVFVFYDMSIDNYILMGKKENYEKIEKKEIFVDGNGDILCCQVCSFSEILKNVEQAIYNKDFEKALLLIDKVSVTKGEYNNALVLLYKLYLSLETKNMEAYSKSLSLLKKIKNDKCKEFIRKGDVGV